MEPQHQHQQPHPNDDNSSGGSGKGSILCRQSSTRWTPTTDQIRILKDLYYNNGVRSPSADQIQRISARLRQYGKIEGKNVFYWFQNHKARERQKKRFTSTPDILPMQTPILANATRKPDDSLHNHKYPTVTPGYAPSSPPSTGVLTVGQIGHYGYGSMTMEKSFRDCSISACGSSSGGASHNFGWVGMDPAYTTSSYAFFDKKKLFGEEQEGDEEEEEEEGAAVAPHIETLPLFPMHGEDINAFCSNMKPQSADSCYSSWYRYDDGYTASRASLELSLNSYNARSQDSI